MNSEHDELQVSTLELFFDLVFVVTITQLTALVEHNTSFSAVIKAAAVFAVMCWMYSGLAVWLLFLALARTAFPYLGETP